MAYFGIAASPKGLRSVRTHRDVPKLLARQIARLPDGAPIVILLHGYRYDPDRRPSDPHRHIFAFRETTACRKTRSWPLGLGFTRHADAGGLCIGFGWPARLSHVDTLLRSGRTGFAEVYRAAPFYGGQLACLVNLIHRMAPGRRLDIVAHSLGARVALSALPRLERAPGRMILLGAAEYRSEARRFLDASGPEGHPEIYNITARFNDLYDTMFEIFAPRQEAADRALGAGLPDAPAGWIDIQIDRGDVTAWINDRGIPLRTAITRFCHWGFYTRGGAFGLYRAILGHQPGWDIETLRRAPCFAVQEPRWSRLGPRRNAGAAPGTMARSMDSANPLGSA